MTQLDELLDELRDLRLHVEDWELLDAKLSDLEVGTPGSGERVQQVVFESRVRGRLQRGRRAPGVAPSKQISALPIVGLVCALLLFSVGYALGGGVVLIGVGALSALVFGVAFAGSKIANGTRGIDAEHPDPVAIPSHVAARIDRIAGRS
jgi:hypothetical protein